MKLTRTLKRKLLDVTRKVSNHVKLHHCGRGVVLGNDEHRLRYKDTRFLSLVACHCGTLSLVTSFGDDTAQSRHFMKDSRRGRQLEITRDPWNMTRAHFAVIRLGKATFWDSSAAMTPVTEMLTQQTIQKYPKCEVAQPHGSSLWQVCFVAATR